jgi:RNA polymerase sigma-70 factor, ECF subfamily
LCRKSGGRCVYWAKERDIERDADLVEKVLKGERSAFAELVARYERVVRSAAFGILRDHHAAQDAAQDAFVLGYRKLGDLRDGAAFGAWVMAIGRRVAIDMARTRERNRAVVEVGARERGLAESAAEDADEQRAAEVLKAVERLPENEKVVVMLRYFGGQSVADVAHATRRPIGTVTKQLSRAISRLREKLRERS